MDREWNDSQPIYRQLRDRVVAMILDGVLKEGDPLPSVRTVAAEYRVNPLTVLKGYQQLVDEGLVETKRGRGMFINIGARDLLMQGERQRFLEEQWPLVYATIQRLGLNPEDLLNGNNHHRAPDAAPATGAEGEREASAQSGTLDTTVAHNRVSRDTVSKYPVSTDTGKKER
jgi:GntR family transcriptional regulator